MAVKKRASRTVRKKARGIDYQKAMAALRGEYRPKGRPMVGDLRMTSDEVELAKLLRAACPDKSVSTDWNAFAMRLFDEVRGKFAIVDWRTYTQWVNRARKVVGNLP
jgi:hypothetical protein